MNALRISGKIGVASRIAGHPWIAKDRILGLLGRIVPVILALAAVTVAGESAYGQPVPRSPQDVPRAVAPSSVAAPQPGQGLLERRRPEYDAIGIRVGSFFFFPALQISERFDDNIYANHSGAPSDFITEISPTLQIRSNFGRHRLNFDFGGVGRIYARHSDEDTLTGVLSSDGLYELSSASSMYGGVRALFGAEPRGSPDAPSTAERPVSYRLISGNIGYANNATAIPIQLTGTVDRYDYDDATLVGGGTVNNQVRNRTDLNAVVRAGYAFWQRVVPFLQVAGNTRIYDHADATGLVRDSSGFSTAVGAAMDFGGLITGEMFAGYAEQYYRDDRLETISGPDVGVRMRWDASPLTTFRFEARTSVNETTLSGSSGSLDTRVRLLADHELLRNVLLNGAVGYSRVDYRQVSRVDDYFDVTVGARYLFNQNFSADVSYAFVDRESTITSESYDRNAVVLRLRMQY